MAAQYVTWECGCKPTRADARDHPRYCGKGREVTRTVLDWRERRKAELAAHHAEPEVPEPLPEPEQRAVVVGADDSRVPKTARAFARLAHEHGWDVQVSYARGALDTGRHGKDFKIVDSVQVLARRDGRRVVAEWLDGKAAACWQTVTDGYLVKVNVTEGKRLLTSSGVTP